MAPEEGDSADVQGAPDGEGEPGVGGTPEIGGTPQIGGEPAVEDGPDAARAQRPVSRQVLAATFDGVADLYDRVRPRYPAALWDDLCSLAGLGPQARLLEVGVGTGRATVPLAERGCAITGLEPGPNLAAIARTHLGGFPAVELRLETFEAYAGQPATFDCVYAATAWHWTDPGTRYRRAAELLRPGGALAVWGSEQAFPVGFDPFFTDLEEVYGAIGEPWEETWPPPPPEEATGWSEEIDASGLFDPCDIRRYVWEQSYDADGLVGLLDSFSSHRVMRPEQRTVLYDEVRHRLAARADGRVRRHWLAVLSVARRRDL